MSSSQQGRTHQGRGSLSCRCSISRSFLRWCSVDDGRRLRKGGSVSYRHRTQGDSSKYDDRLTKKPSSRADRRPGSRRIIRFPPILLERYIRAQFDYTSVIVFSSCDNARAPWNFASESVLLEPNEALCETLIIAGRHSRERERGREKPSL